MFQRILTSPRHLADSHAGRARIIFFSLSLGVDLIRQFARRGEVYACAFFSLSLCRLSPWNLFTCLVWSTITNKHTAPPAHGSGLQCMHTVYFVILLRFLWFLLVNWSAMPCPSQSRCPRGG